MALNIIKDFYGGITRDDKSPSVGVASNVEEFDIFENKDYIRPSQIMSSDTLPSSTEVYSYTADNSDIVYGYGKETSAGKVRIISVSGGGGSNPGSFSTLFTSSDGTNLAYIISPLAYHKTTESHQDYVYYLTKASSTISLKRYDITGTSESTVGTLTGLDGTNDRVFMRRIYGELIIGNGKYLARVDKDGVFTNAAWTLPGGWEAVDICEAGNAGVVLARSVVINANTAKGYFWDLSSLDGFDDSFDVPFGGPQWIVKHAETIKICCAINGQAKFYQLSGAFAGAVPQQIEGMILNNMTTEADTVPLSAPKMTSVKDNILYFALNKTDKSGIYAISQLDQNKKNALVLAKRFATSDYSLHTPYALFIQGPNFYGAFSDNGTASMSRCETLNSPSRSSNAVYETIVIDDKSPASFKRVTKALVTTRPLAASTSVTLSIATDYGSYVALARGDGSVMNTTGDTVGVFEPKIANVKTYKFKITATSNGANAPYITSLSWISEVNNSIPGK